MEKCRYCKGKEGGDGFVVGKHFLTEKLCGNGFLESFVNKWMVLMEDGGGNRVDRSILMRCLIIDGFYESLGDGMEL